MEREVDFRDYRRKGLAARSGFGRRPALLVVDMTRGFTDPHSPLGADMSAPLQATAELLAACRRQGIPVLFTAVVYEPDLRQAPIFLSKVPSLKRLVRGSDAVQVDPAVAPRDDEPVIEKQYASAFFGTDLHRRLCARRVDTLLIAGCTTSGCVRASAVDALQHDYRAIVIEEAVGDRAAGPHEANLFDLDAKYADVMPLAEVLDYLRSLEPAAHPQRPSTTGAP